MGRIYWAFVGNHHARELFTLPITQKAYWQEVLTMFKWYAFLIPQPSRYVGHNPLARMAMFFGFFFISLFMIATGFAMYGEGAQAGSWAERVFGWVIPMMGQSQEPHTASLRPLGHGDVRHAAHLCRDPRGHHGPQSIVSTMISGYRTFKK